MCVTRAVLVRVAFDQEVIGLTFGAGTWPGIESIKLGSAAYGRLWAGMILVEIQGADMRGKSLEDASEALQAAGRPLSLAFLAPEAQLEHVL